MLHKGAFGTPICRVKLVKELSQVYNIFMNPLVVLTLLFIVTSSITTLDKRLIQAKRAGDIPADEPR
jgi:hypothetical protein